MSEQLRREGENLQRLLDEVRDEFGPTVQILSATKTRVGGVLGFFASQRYILLAAVPEPTSGAVRTAIPATPAPSDFIPTPPKPDAPAPAPSPVLGPVRSVQAARVWGNVATQSVAPALTAPPAAADNAEHPMALASQILRAVEQERVPETAAGPEPPAHEEQPTPEQAFAAALADAVEMQSTATSLDAGVQTAERSDPASQAQASPDAGAQQPVEVPTDPPADAPAVAASEQPTDPPAEAPAAAAAATASVYTVKPAVFTRIARAHVPPVPHVPRVPHAVAGTELATAAAGARTAAPSAAPTDAAAHAVRPPGSRPTAGEVVAVIGDVDVIRSEAIALLRRWKVLTDTVTDPATQASLALAMESSRALVVTGPTPGLLQSDQLDGQQWMRWRSADVPVVVLIPTAALTRAGSRQLAQRLVALGADRVLAVVDASDATENLRHWLRGFAGVQGLLAHHVGAARNPTDVAQLGLPVVALDGRAATAARWRTYFRGKPTPASPAAIAPGASAKRKVDAR